MWITNGRKALKLDPSLAEAHATEGLILQEEYRLREAAEEELRKINRIEAELCERPPMVL